MKALITVAVDVDPEGYEFEYGMRAKAVEVLGYVKDLIRESSEIQLNRVGGWAKITKVEVSAPIDGPPGQTWEEVWEQVRNINAGDHLNRMVAIAIPSPFMEEKGAYVVAYVDRETRIH